MIFFLKIIYKCTFIEVDFLIEKGYFGTVFVVVDELS
jgi:hypothetical protein